MLPQCRQGGEGHDVGHVTGGLDGLECTHSAPTSAGGASPTLEDGAQTTLESALSAAAAGKRPGEGGPARASKVSKASRARPCEASLGALSAPPPLTLKQISDDALGVKVLTLVAREFGAPRALWGVCRSLDLEAPRRIHLCTQMTPHLQERMLAMLRGRHHALPPEALETDKPREHEEGQEERRVDDHVLRQGRQRRRQQHTEQGEALEQFSWASERRVERHEASNRRRFVAIALRRRGRGLTCDEEDENEDEDARMRDLSEFAAGAHALRRLALPPRVALAMAREKGRRIKGQAYRGGAVATRGAELGRGRGRMTLRRRVSGDAVGREALVSFEEDEGEEDDDDDDEDEEDSDCDDPFGGSGDEAACELWLRLRAEGGSQRAERRVCVTRAMRRAAQGGSSPLRELEGAMSTLGIRDGRMGGSGSGGRSSRGIALRELMLACLDEGNGSTGNKRRRAGWKRRREEEISTSGRFCGPRVRRFPFSHVSLLWAWASRTSYPISGGVSLSDEHDERGECEEGGGGDGGHVGTARRLHAALLRRALTALQEGTKEKQEGELHIQIRHLRIGTFCHDPPRGEPETPPEGEGEGEEAEEGGRQGEGAAETCPPTPLQVAAALVLPPSLTTLEFGDMVDCPSHALPPLPASLVELRFGRLFDQAGLKLPGSLRRLIFGYAFNKEVVLPEGLLQVTFGTCYNTPVTLPRSLERVVFSERFNSSVRFSEGSCLSTIIFGHAFNSTVVLPPSVKTLSFGRCFSRDIKYPPGLVSLRLGGQLNMPVELPASLRNIIFGERFNVSVCLPEGLEEVIFGLEFNQPVTLPTSTIKVTYGHYFAQTAHLPEGLQEASFGFHFRTPLQLPASLKRLTVRGPYGHALELPSSIREVTCDAPTSDLLRVPAGLRRVGQGIGKYRMVVHRFEPLATPSVP